MLLIHFLLNCIVLGSASALDRIKEESLQIAFFYKVLGWNWATDRINSTENQIKQEL
jgi:hypothetical protein